MQNKNQRIIEKEFQKALAIEYVKTFCLKNNLSLKKLQTQRFVLSGNECAFAQPSDIKPNGLINDRDTMPKVTLIIKFEDRQLRIEKTEYTEVFLREG
ncbi:MAG: hypothetical protein K2P44_04270 [Lachnospiraceae bacterium]|nr:hypothetical protein [Lachnospiraceae bacterium]